MSLVNDVELSLAGTHPGGSHDRTRMTINGVEIRGLVSVELSACKDSMTEVAIRFYARVNQPKATE